jgi:hypothetical protein
MQDVHPSDCLGVVYLAEIDLGGLQILVPQNNFRYDFQGHTVSAGVGCRVSPEIMRRNTDIHYSLPVALREPLPLSSLWEMVGHQIEGLYP